MNKRVPNETCARCWKGWNLYFQILDEYNRAMGQDPGVRDWSRHSRKLKEMKEHKEDCQMCQEGEDTLPISIEELPVEEGRRDWFNSSGSEEDQKGSGRGSGILQIGFEGMEMESAS